MKSFFRSDQIIKKATRTRAGKQLNFSCDDCGLDRGCLSPKMPPFGNFKKGIMIIGEAPGKNEDEKNRPFCGDADQLLKAILRKYGIDLDNDCIITNGVICRPPQNRTPSDLEIKCCRPKLFTTIAEYKPKKIITLGKPALLSLIAHRTKNFGEIGKWVGFKIPDQEIGLWVYPNYHPAFVLRNKKNKATELLFRQYLQEAIEDDRTFPDYSDYTSKIKILVDEREIIQYLKWVYENVKLMAFDYETTGKKPHRKGHKILCMSIATSYDNSVSFPFLSDNPEFLRYIQLILTNPKIRKIAANLKFEDTWTRVILGYKVQGWYWDTMINAHVLDNRRGITGLKSQSYLRWGIMGYENDVEPYMETDKNAGANAFNKLEYLFKKDPMIVLTYNNLDSKFEFKLFEEQLEESMKTNITGFNLFHEGVLALCEIESHGVHIDVSYYDRQLKLMERKIRKTEREIQESNEAILYKSKKRSELNTNSPVQLKTLFYDILKYTPIKMTKGTKNNPEGNPSTDFESLFEFGTDFSNKIVLLRKQRNLRDRIIEFLREEVDGIMYPTAFLNIAISFRSAMMDPNFQNIPKRDRVSQELIRSGILPSPGKLIMDIDYKGIEVGMAACNNKDPVLISYIKDKTKDMHRDSIMEILMLKKNQVTKMLRYYGKNGFVFPEFYGDYYVDCAKSIWKGIQKEETADGIPVLDHLRDKGIFDYLQFEEHVRGVERNFWYKKFKVYREWKERIWNQYQEQGYVDLLSGFRCSGLMDKKDVTNYPNQGPGFHCLLWSLIQVQKRALKEKWNSKIIGQIHDQLVIDTDPNEIEYIVPIIKKIMCEDIVKHWPWIIVPLEVEIEVSEVDGNWYDKKELDL